MWLIKLKYYLGVLMALPLLPLMARHGKLVKNAVPALPEPTDYTGTVPKSTTPSFTLITMGESTIAGVGVKHHREGFTGCLAKEVAEHTGQAVGWQVYAKSGYTAKHVSKKLIPNMPIGKADLIAIGLGANDAFRVNSPMKWSQHIQTLIEQVQSKFPESPIVFLNMPPIKSFPAMTRILQLTLGNLISLHGEALKLVIQNYDNVYYNSEKITLANWSRKYKIENDASKYFSDGIHPSQLTYALWAKDVMSLIKAKGLI